MASQHEFLKRANLVKFARLCCPKDTLSQVADLPVDLAPVDARPVGGSLGSVCMVYTKHLTFPSIGNLYFVLWVTHQVHVSTLSGWVFPIQPVMYSRCLSTAGLRFLDPPTPTEEFCRPYGWLTEHNFRPHWGYHVPLCRDSIGGGAFFTPGSWCPSSSVFASLLPTRAAKFPGSIDPTLPYFPSYQQPDISKPHQRFTCVHPSNLPFARFLPMVGISLGLYSWLRTSPLLMTHAGIKDWLWTLARMELPSLYQSDFMSHLA